MERLVHNVVEFVGRSPDVQKLMPELPKLLADVKPAVTGTRILLTVDAKRAASLIDSASRPARQAAIRSQCVNNEKQIGLAIHNYIARHDSFPPAYTRDKAGKPLLSWRVLILPYIEQDALYKEFHLDESWDSPHNRALISKMPATYRCPGESGELAGQGKTRYLAPRGKATIFGGSDPVKLRDVTDGTSNTDHGRRGGRRERRRLDQAGRLGRRSRAQDGRRLRAATPAESKMDRISCSPTVPCVFSTRPSLRGCSAPC